ncbi:MAG: hypothetical protein HYT61_00865 [Candidatus Yanofskybacteria bacterium]|nr:hypothetical protein [Candidatus Yanofskybacteria bacterium]
MIPYVALLLIGFLIGYFANQYLLLVLGYAWLWCWYYENSLTGRHPDVPGSGIVLVIFGGVILFAGVFLLTFQWSGMNLLSKIFTAFLVVWIFKILGPLFADVHKRRIV